MEPNTPRTMASRPLPPLKFHDGRSQEMKASEILSPKGRSTTPRSPPGSNSGPLYPHPPPSSGRKSGPPSRCGDAAIVGLSGMIGDMDRLSASVMAGAELSSSYGYGGHEITTEVRALKAGLSTAINATKDALSLEVGERRKLQRECEVLSDQLARSTAEKTMAQAKLRDMESKFRDLEDRLLRFQPRVSEAVLEQQMRQKEVEVSMARGERNSILAEKVALASENDSLRSQLNIVRRSYEQSIDHPSSAFAATVRRLEMAQSEKDVLENQLINSKGESGIIFARLQNELANSAHHELLLREAKGAYDQVLKQLESERAAHQRALTKAISERESLARESKAARESLEQQVGTLASKLTKFEMDVSAREADREKALVRANADTARLQAEVGELHRLISVAQLEKEQAVSQRLNIERQMDAATREHAQIVSQAQSDHAAFVHVLQDEHASKLAHLEREHRAVVRELSEEITRARTEREDTVKVLRDRLAKVSDEAEQAAVREIAEKSALQVEIKILQEKNATMEVANADLHAALAALQHQVADERTTCANLRTTVAELESKIQILDSKNQALNAVLAKERDANAVLSSKIAQLEDATSRLDGALSIYKGQLGQDRHALKNALDQMADAQSDKAAFEEVSRMMHIQVENERSANRVLENSVQFLHAQLEQERVAQQAREATIATLNKQVDEARRVHTAAVKLLETHFIEEKEARLAAEQLVRSLQVQLEAHRTSVRSQVDKSNVAG